jgi:hypothetical protein
LSPSSRTAQHHSLTPPPALRTLLLRRTRRLLQPWLLPLPLLVADAAGPACRNGRPCDAGQPLIIYTGSCVGPKNPAQPCPTCGQNSLAAGETYVAKAQAAPTRGALCQTAYVSMTGTSANRRDASASGNAARARLDGTVQTAGVEVHPRGAGKLWLEFSSRYKDADWLFNSSVTSTCAQTGAPVAGQALNEAYASYKECVRRSTAAAIRCCATPQPFALARTTPASTT